MEAQSERTPAEVSVADIGLDMLVAPESVGRNLQSVVQEAREVKRKNVVTFATNGPGSLWWASFIKTRFQGGRSILRPRTQFDRIQLGVGEKHSLANERDENMKRAKQSSPRIA